MSIQKAHSNRVATIYQIIRTPKKLVEKKEVRVDEYVDNERIEVYLMLFYLLTRAKNEGTDTIQFRVTDYLAFYDVKQGSGSRYADAVHALGKLKREGISVFGGISWNSFPVLYDVEPIYSKRTIGRAFAVNDRLMEEMGISEEAKKQLTDQLRERGLRLRKVRGADREYPFRLHDEGPDDVIFEAGRIGDEIGLFETDDAGNIQPDLFGNGPRRYKAQGYKIAFVENFLRDVREKKLSILWVDRKYAVALMRHKASKQIVRGILELAKYSSSVSIRDGWVFNWTEAALRRMLGIRSKDPKKVRAAIRKVFKACKEAGLITEIPRPIEAENRVPGLAMYRLKRDQIACPNGSQN